MKMADPAKDDSNTFQPSIDEVQASFKVSIEYACGLHGLRNSRYLEGALGINARAANEVLLEYAKDHGVQVYRYSATNWFPSDVVLEVIQVEYERRLAKKDKEVARLTDNIAELTAEMDELRSEKALLEGRIGEGNDGEMGIPSLDELSELSDHDL